VAEVGKGIPEIDARIFFTLAVFVRVSVTKVALEVGVGDGVAANGTSTSWVFELFSCENIKCVCFNLSFLKPYFYLTNDNSEMRNINPL
jgi:hypothetical protein